MAAFLVIIGQLLCYCLIICDSKNSRASKWVQSEVKYIKSKQRTYETINLNQSDDKIKKKLDSYIKNTQIFLSYSRKDTYIAEEVYSHINKYDIRCWVDEIDLKDNYDNLEEQITHAIHLAKDSGFVVFFASTHSLHSEWCVKEIQEAEKIGANLFILLLDKYAKDNIKYYFSESHDRTQSGGFPVTDSFLTKDISMYNSDQQIEMAIEEIVNRTFPFWDTYTMALNFLKGIDCPIDEKEANRLLGIAFRKADDLDAIGYPGGTLFVARCMANGYGTKKDLDGALGYYQSYIRTCGSNKSIDKEIEELKREIDQLSKEIK